MRRIVLAAFSLIFLAACQPATDEMTAEREAEIAAEVKLLHGQSVDAWRAADLDRAMSYYRNSPDYAEVIDGQLTIGFDAVVEGWRSVFVNVASQTLEISDLQAMVLAPNVVCMNEVATFTVTDTMGVVGPEVPYVYSSIWVREGGEWKIHFGHQSSPIAENP